MYTSNSRQVLWRLCELTVCFPMSSGISCQSASRSTVFKSFNVLKILSWFLLNEFNSVQKDTTFHKGVVSPSELYVAVQDRYTTSITYGSMQLSKEQVDGKSTCAVFVTAVSIFHCFGKASIPYICRCRLNDAIREPLISCDKQTLPPA